MVKQAETSATEMTGNGNDSDSKMMRIETTLSALKTDDHNMEATNHNVEVTSSDQLLLSPQQQDQTPSLDDEDARSNSITPETDLSDSTKRIWIVTTAGLPWRTGTAVNPLARALYLTRNRIKGAITLMIPWLSDPEARSKLYGDKHHDDMQTPQQQEAWIRDYCQTRCQISKGKARWWWSRRQGSHVI